MLQLTLKTVAVHQKADDYDCVGEDSGIFVVSFESYRVRTGTRCARFRGAGTVGCNTITTRTTVSYTWKHYTDPSETQEWGKRG